MKAHYKTASGKMTFEVEGSTVVDLFKGVAQIAEAFDHAACGSCGSVHVVPVARHNSGHDFYEIGCKDCGARLALGQHKVGGTLFPKRRDDQGNYIADGGWTKYQRNE